jgi:arylsulfatase A-like enzyme
VAGSRLEFAFAVLDQAPDLGFVHFEVRLGDRTLARQRVSVKRRRHWFRQSVRFDGPAAGRLSFRFIHARIDGQPLDAASTDGSAWLALSLPRVYAPAPPGRVLVWISQDTLRADHLGAYGYGRDTSPRFDARARDWILFEDATASSSWTLPSMVSQFTAQPPSLHGAVLHDLLPDPRAQTLFQGLAHDGFTVLGVTSNDLITPDLTMTRGFDALWYVEGRAPELSRRLLAALDEWEGGDLALFIHLMDSHAPYLPPKSTRFRFHRPHDGPEPATGWESLRLLKAPADIEHIVAIYDEEIAYADAAIDDLLRALDERGLLQRAVIAYTSDHGEEFGEHGGWQHGGTLHQEVLRVPLALRVPGLPGARVRRPVSLVDLAPTLQDVLKVPSPQSFWGRSLLKGLAAAGGGVGRPIISETQLTPQHEALLAWRTGPMKVVIHTPRGVEAPLKVLSEDFYDLEADPGETRRAAAGPPHRAAHDAALAYLEDARRQAGAPRPASLDKGTLDRLRALGYLR